jgi:hypothetical protein
MNEFNLQVPGKLVLQLRRNTTHSAFLESWHSRAQHWRCSSDTLGWCDRSWMRNIHDGWDTELNIWRQRCPRYSWTTDLKGRGALPAGTRPLGKDHSHYKTLTPQETSQARGKSNYSRRPFSHSGLKWWAAVPTHLLPLSKFLESWFKFNCRGICCHGNKKKNIFSGHLASQKSITLLIASRSK